MTDSLSPDPVTPAAVAELRASLDGMIAAVAGTSTPPPAGGSVAAAAGALAAALAQMVAGLTVGRPRYAHIVNDMQEAARRAAALASELSALVERDAAAYGAVAQAYKLPKGTGNAALARSETIQRAMS